MECLNLGSYISNLRKNKLLTQKELANILHVSDKMISRYETGIYKPSLEILHQMSQVFDVPLSDFLEINEKNSYLKESKKPKKNIKKIILPILLIANVSIKISTIIIPIFIKYKYIDALNIISVGLLCVILYLVLKKDL